MAAELAPVIRLDAVGRPHVKNLPVRLASTRAAYGRRRSIAGNPDLPADHGGDVVRWVVVPARSSAQ